MVGRLKRLFLGGNGLAALTAALVAVAAMGQTAGAPANVQLTPNTGQQGQTVSVTAHGVPCQGLVSISFSPPGLLVSNLQCQQQAATLAAFASAPTFTITISPEAEPGPYTMMVTMHDGRQVVRIPSAFIVTPAPQRAAALFLIPNSGQQGQTLNVTAQGLPCSPRLRLSFLPEGLSVSNLQCAGGGVAGNVAGVTFTLTISPAARLGPYTLVASYGPESRRVPGAFTVLPGVPPQGAPPRVDRVSPQDLEPGKSYTLDIYGFAFSPGMTIDFGPDLQNMTPPVILDTQRAQLTVLVSPSALEGVRLAQARNASGQGNKGPGGIRVVPAKKGVPLISPTTVKLPAPVVKPHGHIVLWAPNHQGGGEFQTVQMGDNPPVVQKDTLFSWYEENPGVANYFVMSIMDESGKVLAQAQTSNDKPYYRVTVAFLQNLPDGSTLPMFNWTPPKPIYASPVAPGVISQAVLTQGSSASSSSSKSSLISRVPTQAKINAMLASMNSSAPASSFSAIEFKGIFPSGHVNALWQVKGFWKNPATGEEEEVESSDQYPLLLPGKAQGLGDCSKAAPGSSIQASAPGSGAVPLVGQTILLSGQIDVSRSPYPISASMSMMSPFGGPVSTQYSNLYVSWGDGEVDNLNVDAPSSGAQTISIVLGGNPLQHAYRQAGTYNIQIYASADPEKHDGTVPGILRGSSLYSSALSALLAQPQPAAYEGKSQGIMPVSAINVGPASVASNETPVLAKIPISTSLPGFQSGANAYLVACASIDVQEPENAVANGRLHLASVAVTSFPGHSENPPQVSDCSDSFTGIATLSYCGKGTIGVTWNVDGVDIPGSDMNIGPGGREPNATVQIESPPLPAALTGHPHDLKVTVWVVSDGYGTSVGGGSSSDSGGMSAGGGGSSSPFTVLRPSVLGMAQLGSVVSLSGSSGTGGTSSASKSLPFSVAASMPLLISIIANEPPDRRVVSPVKQYDVVPHDPSKPCGITFPTKDGDFTIGDLGSDFTMAPDGTASGSGKLHLKLPEGASGTQDIFVPVTFSNWHLSGSGGGRTVADGTPLDEDVTKDINVVGLAGTIKHLKATAGSTSSMEVTMHLGISAFAGLSPLSALQWDVTAPITPSGDFYSDSLTISSADIGLSGFKLKGVGLVLDLSRSQGSAPSGDTCSASGSGAAWTGLYIKSGTLGLYAFNLPVSVSMPTPDISGWAIGSSGLEGKITSQSLGVTVPLGLGDLNIKTMDFNVCGSSLVAKYSLSVENVPLINTNLDGTFQVDSHGNMATSFSVPSIEKNFSVIDLKLFNADFKNEQNVGWRVAMDAQFKLMAAGSELYSFSLNGLRVTMDGKIALQGGATSIDLPLGGSAELGPVQIDIQKLSLLVGAESGNPYVGFSLTGGVHLSNVLQVSVGNLQYKLVYKNGGFSGEGPSVDSIKVHAQYPDVSPTVTLDVELTYSNSGGNTRFGGQGTLSIVNAVDIQAAFLVGYQGSQDYWMARASIPLGPSGIALFPPFLSLYQLQGGLGHNVPLSALSGTTALSDIQPTFDGSYSFMAGARLGSSDGGFTYCFDGTLTIKATGSDAGFRIDAKAWILTDDHSGNGQFQGFMQYASGSFDTGLSGSWSFLNGAVSITAPSKAVSIHFGSGDWHIYIGQNAPGLKLTAHVLLADCHGYCMLDNTGFRVGGDVSYHLHWGGSLWGFGAHVDADASASLDVAILFSPLHISGDFNASASLGGGLDTPVGCLCISLSGGLSLHAEAMPVSICGKAWIDFGQICWCFVGCCDDYSVTVGPLCV